MSLAYTSVDKVLAIEPMIGSLTSLTSAHIFLFAQQAEAEVNGSIVRNFTLPISDSVPLLEAIATDVTIYRIFSRRNLVKEKFNDSVWPDRFKEARKMLDAIANGKTLLVNSAGVLVGNRSDVAEVKTNQSGYFPTTTELDELDQFQDPDKTDDLLSDRSLGTRRYVK